MKVNEQYLEKNQRRLDHQRLIQNVPSNPWEHSSNILSKKMENEITLFQELLQKTKSRLESSINRVSELICKLRLMKAQILSKLLSKVRKIMKVMCDDLCQIEAKFQNNEGCIFSQKVEQKPALHDKKKNSCSQSQQTESQCSVSDLELGQVNIGVFADVIRIENRVLSSLEGVSFKIHYRISQGKIESKIKSYAKRITVIVAKLATIHLIFPFAAYFPKNDLFSLHRGDQRWTLLNIQYVKKIVYGVSERVLQTFNEYVNYITYFMYFAFQVMKQSDLLNFLDKQELFNETWAEILELLTNKVTSNEEMKTIYSLQTSKFPKILWQITNQRLFKALISPVIPYIAFTKCLFVPKHRRLQIIQSICDNKKPFYFISFLQKPFKLQDYLEEKPYQTHAQIRVNCNYQFYDQGAKKVTKDIIVHIHGGGFISMSAYVHQFYIRKWAKEINVPVFSIQYGKAPQYPFPNALADCIEAYLWLVENASRLYNARRVRILLMGDSSGGNLACSLLNFLIRYDLPLPKGVILFYPALRVELFYTPSFLHGIDDMILSHSILLKIRHAYVGNFANSKSDYISPILTDQAILKRYPLTQFITGSKDPLSDDCFRMVQNINIAKQGTAFLTLFEDFPHGFLHFDSDFLPNQFTRQAVGHIQQMICTMLSQIQKMQ